MRFHAVATPANGFDQGGVLRFTTDFLEQFADENVDNLHFRLVNAAITAGHTEEAETQNNGLISLNIGQFNTALPLSANQPEYSDFMGFA